jgi:hypothetical protein
MCHKFLPVPHVVLSATLSSTLQWPALHQTQLAPPAPLARLANSLVITRQRHCTALHCTLRTNLFNAPPLLQVLAPDYQDVTPQYLSVLINRCRDGEIRDSLGCTPCDPNQYSLLYSPTATCTPCKEFATCAGGSAFVPACGFWHSRADSDLVMPCPNTQACCDDKERTAVIKCQNSTTCRNSSTYADTQCRPGYRGNLCGSCHTAAGYGMAGPLRCARCYPQAVGWLLVGFAMLFGAGVVVFFTNNALLESEGVIYRDPESSPPQKERLGRSQSVIVQTAQTLAWKVYVLAWKRKPVELSGVFKILVLHLQYLAIVGSLLVDWPGVVVGLVGFVKLFAVISVDASKFVSLECLGVRRAATNLYLSLLLPLLVVGLAAVVVVVLGCRKSAIERQQARNQDDRITPVDMLIVAAVVGAFLVYSGLVTTSLSTFSCMQVGCPPYLSACLGRPAV